MDFVLDQGWNCTGKSDFGRHDFFGHFRKLIRYGHKYIFIILNIYAHQIYISMFINLDHVYIEHMITLTIMPSHIEWRDSNDPGF